MLQRFSASGARILMRWEKGVVMKVTTLGHIKAAGKSLGGYMKAHELNDSVAHRQAQYHLRRAYAILKQAGAK